MRYYVATGRLTGVSITSADLNIRIPYVFDPAGNRMTNLELDPDHRLKSWPNNRIVQNAHYLYHHDNHDRLTRQEINLPPGAVHMSGELIRHYRYDHQHRLVAHACEQIWSHRRISESRYVYDPLGRRVGKKVWKSNRYGTGESELVVQNPTPEVTWYGWDGDRLVTTQTESKRVQTVYQPGSFTPPLRIETENSELAKTAHRCLADKLQQEGNIVFPAELISRLDLLERELQHNAVSEENRQWLAGCGLTPEQMVRQMEPVYVPERKIHLYHCDHRGLPLALINENGTAVWRAEYDEWGNQLNEDNPENLQQLIRLPGQQYDEETGLHYNRYRYYDPRQGRYITQDPIGLKGGWNSYQYPLNPVANIDPLGLETLKCIKPLHSMGGTGEKSGPDIWGNPFYHEYICVSDSKGGYICGGQDQRGESKGDGLWGPGKPSYDTKEGAGRCDSVETDNSCIENCLKEKFKQGRPRYSVLPDRFTIIKLGLFKNCQDWADDSLETCKMKCSGNNMGRLIRFVLTGVI